MKNKNVLLIARFSVQNFKVSVESWKSYIVERVEEVFLLGFVGNKRGPYCNWGWGRGHLRGGDLPPPEISPMRSVPVCPHSGMHGRPIYRWRRSLKCHCHAMGTVSFFSGSPCIPKNNSIPRWWVTWVCHIWGGVNGGQLLVHTYYQLAKLSTLVQKNPHL